MIHHNANGAGDLRAITDAQTAAGPSLALTIDSASSQALSAANVTRIEFLTKHRLAVSSLFRDNLFTRTAKPATVCDLIFPARTTINSLSA